ncbi:MAG: hypothetical protein IPM32_10850 [Ignavibacteriae bacterium]|nr:hypothetical protein [Ignavibacteriota bacterium]
MNYEKLYQKIKWHDLSVDKIIIDTEKKVLQIIVSEFDENEKDFKLVQIIFSEIIKISSNDISFSDLTNFDKEYSAEIFSFEINNKPNGDLQSLLNILLGFGKPDLILNILSRKIEIKYCD